MVYLLDLGSAYITEACKYQSHDLIFFLCKLYMAAFSCAILFHRKEVHMCHIEESLVCC